LKKIEPESARSMEILEFVRLDEIDPLYYESSYYVTPEDEGRKAYQLLLDAMEDSGYAAIAKITMHQREHIVVIRPRENGMTLHTMFYNNEIREVAEYGKRTPAAEPKEAEKKLATQLIESLAAKFEPEKIQRPISGKHASHDCREASRPGSSGSAAHQAGPGNRLDGSPEKEHRRKIATVSQEAANRAVPAVSAREEARAPKRKRSAG